MGAKIASPQRQASIKRALLAVFEREAREEKPRKVAAAR
jgi:hypothetical protein